MGKVQCNLFLDEELIRKMKHRAIDEQLGLSDWVTRAANESLWTSDQNGKEPVEKHMRSKQEIEFMPIIHVQDMEASIRFYEGLGGILKLGSRDGDWAEVALGKASVGLLAHPSPDGEESVEIAFRFDGPLTLLNSRVRTAGLQVKRDVTAEGFGEQLQLADPDGRTVKINRIEPMLIQ